MYHPFTPIVNLSQYALHTVKCQYNLLCIIDYMQHHSLLPKPLKLLDFVSKSCAQISTKFHDFKI